MEKYIEKAGYYSDWEQRRQVQNNPVIRADMNGPEKKDQLSLFAAAVFGAMVTFELGKSSLKSHKKQFHKWINATGITVQNCPPRLRLIFYALNEVLEGREEKLEHDIENKKPDLDPDSPEFKEWEEYAFSQAVQNLGKELEWEEIKGDSEKGEKVFQEILSSVPSTDYENFYWVPQKEEVPTDNSLAAEAAIQELKKLLDKAEVEKNMKSDNRSGINKIIQQLEEFRDNSAAHEGKNKYAWQKLNGGGKLSDLRINLKIRDFREQIPSPLPQNKTNNSTKYWVGGISVALGVGLIVAVVVMIKKRKN